MLKQIGYSRSLAQTSLKKLINFLNYKDSLQDLENTELGIIVLFMESLMAKY